MKPKADIFAGDGSFAGKLRRRRDAVEAGDMVKAREEMISGADGGEADGGNHDMPDMRYKKGYRSSQ